MASSLSALPRSWFVTWLMGPNLRAQLSVLGLRSAKSYLDPSRSPGPKLVDEPVEERQAAGEMQVSQA